MTLLADFSRVDRDSPPAKPLVADRLIGSDMRIELASHTNGRSFSSIGAVATVSGKFARGRLICAHPWHADHPLGALSFECQIGFPAEIQPVTTERGCVRKYDRATLRQQS